MAAGGQYATARPPARGKRVEKGGELPGREAQRLNPPPPPSLPCAVELGTRMEAAGHEHNALHQYRAASHRCAPYAPALANMARILAKHGKPLQVQ